MYYVYAYMRHDGTSSNIKNLKAFCRENGLDYTTMQFVAKGAFGCSQHKGFTVNRN